MAEVLDPKASGARRFEGQVAVVTGGGQGIGAAEGILRRTECQH